MTVEKHYYVPVISGQKDKRQPPETGGRIDRSGRFEREMLTVIPKNSPRSAAKSRDARRLRPARTSDGRTFKALDEIQSGYAKMNFWHTEKLE